MLHVKNFLHKFIMVVWHLYTIWYNMCNKIRKQKITKLFILLPNIQMKKELLLGLGLAAWAAAYAQEWVTPETKTIEKETEAKKEIVIQQDSTRKEVADTISRYDATWWEWVWIEPDPVDWDSEELDPTTDEWSDTWIEKESPTKFTISTWLWYSVGWKTFMSNRVAWFGQMPWGINVYSHIDFDDPLHSTWSWKLTLSKSVYKWITLDWDYTFTWTWWNVARLWIWYGWKIWDWTYWIKLYPLNTSWSPIAAKVSVSTKIWSNWQLSSFVFVDFQNLSYYSETEYAQQVAKWIAIFMQARLWWVINGSFNWDSQKFVWWVRISVK